MIEIDELVSITNTGRVYSTYVWAFERFGFKKQDTNRTHDNSGRNITTGVWKVLDSCMHQNKRQGMIYAIEHVETGHQLVIGEEGIKIIK